MKQDSTSRFLSIYNEIDHYMRGILNSQDYVDHGVLLRQMSERNRLFSDYYKDLKLFAELRNLLVHNPYPDRANPLIIPHEYITQKYEEIKNSIMRPKKAIDIAVRREFIYTTTLSTASKNYVKLNNRY